MIIEVFSAVVATAMILLWFFSVSYLIWLFIFDEDE